MSANMYKVVEAGKIGETICLLRLLKLEVPCQVVHMTTMDMVAQTVNGLIRIQVKSSQYKENGSRHGYQFSTAFGGKKHPLTKNECDVVAFVSLDREKVLFKPVECLRGSVTKRFLPKKFDDEKLELRTWNHCMDYMFL